MVKLRTDDFGVRRDVIDQRHREVPEELGRRGSQDHFRRRGIDVFCHSFASFGEDLGACLSYWVAGAELNVVVEKVGGNSEQVISRLGRSWQSASILRIHNFLEHLTSASIVKVHLLLR